MDLNKLDYNAFADKGAVMYLVDTPELADTPSFDVLGTDSKAFNDYKIKASREALISGDKKTSEEYRLGFLCSVITGWKNIELDGKKLAFNAKNLLMVLKRFKWIADKIEEFAGNRVNFTPS